MDSNHDRDLATWKRLWDEVSERSESAETILGVIKERYAERHRRYHTFEHVRACLRLFEDFAGAPKSPEAFELAIYYHDVVYDIPAAFGENERASSDFARVQLTSFHIDRTVVETVIKLIGATDHFHIDQMARLAEADHHDARQRQGDEMLFCDLDLAILGAGLNEFERYEYQIREEYAEIDDETYRVERIKFIRSIMHREHIFQTRVFRRRYEDSARENLSRVLARLER